MQHFRSVRRPKNTWKVDIICRRIMLHQKPVSLLRFSVGKCLLELIVDFYRNLSFLTFTILTGCSVGKVGRKRKMTPYVIADISNDIIDSVAKFKFISMSETRVKMHKKLEVERSWK